MEIEITIDDRSSSTVTELVQSSNCLHPHHPPHYVIMVWRIFLVPNATCARQGADKFFFVL
jgi:hypothetical protein